MGVVYEAEQTEPVRRLVALKIMKVGMDTKEVVARFEVERQALAVMSHPGIAKVLDAGVSEEGRPYFAMVPARRREPVYRRGAGPAHPALRSGGALPAPNEPR